MKRVGPSTPLLQNTLPEIIFSLLLLALAIIALVLAVLEYRRTEEASRTVFTVVAMDQELARSLTDLKNYEDETTKLALRSGRLPPNLAFHLSLHLPDRDVAIVLHPGERAMFDRDLKTCNRYPYADCGYKIRLNLEQHPAAFSYTVSSAFPEAALTIERRDRTAIVVPKSAYRDPMHVACSPRREIGLSGLLSSDRYECLGRPQLACARGTLPKALVVNPKTRSLEFDCGTPSKVVRCPAYYALSKVDTKSLDAGEAKAAQCVRVTRAIASPAKQPAPAVHVTGQACPTGYRSESTCTLVNVRVRPGRCGAGSVAQPPVAGKIMFSENKPLGAVDCGVDLPTQSCGAIWQALAQLTIKCVLDQPETANAL